MNLQCEQRFRFFCSTSCKSNLSSPPRFLSRLCAAGGFCPPPSFFCPWALFFLSPASFFLVPGFCPRPYFFCSRLFLFVLAILFFVLEFWVLLSSALLGVLHGRIQRVSRAPRSVWRPSRSDPSSMLLASRVSPSPRPETMPRRVALIRGAKLHAVQQRGGEVVTLSCRIGAGRPRSELQMLSRHGRARGRRRRTSMRMRPEEEEEE